jgi:putative peptide zinc metalloprotease protein
VSGGLFNPYWYRVRGLRPCLRGHVKIHRQEYRGERWYLLHDSASGRHHRFSPVAYSLIALMDGRRTLEEIQDATDRRLGDDAPTQGETIHLISQLHVADVIRCDVTPDASEVFDRFAAQHKSSRRSRFANPLYIRLPLFDPDAFLERWLPVVRPVFSGWGLAAWLAVVVWGVALAGTNWRALAAVDLESVLDPLNLALLVVTYPLVKAIHELGHAFATKAWGGEVHEVGIMFLVFAPVPYVDASAAWAFREKGRRMTVGAAGVMVELFLAAIALAVWLETEPGIVHGIAWNIMLIGGTSTLLFNGNPLLRFDGYYVLADAIEIPNLAGRAQKHLAYLFQHYVLGLPERRRIMTAPGEKAWFVCYGVGAFVYRIAITIGIAFFVATKFFVVGVLLAIWGLAMQTLVPAVRSLRRLMRDPRVPRKLGRVTAGSAVVVTAAILLLFVVPMPVRTHAEGVVWPPEQSQVRAGGAGFVRRILARPGTHVERGEPLVEIDDPIQRKRIRALAARERELRTRYQAARVEDLAQSDIVLEELETARAELAQERQRGQERTVRSPATGTFVLPVAQNLPGRYVERGEVLGYVADFAAPTVRALVSQADIGRVRTRTRGVEVRLAERVRDVIPAHLSRELPTATRQLPSMALGAAGGGRMAVDRRDAEGLTAVDTFFQFDLELPPETSVRAIGGRVFVRFDHGSSALAPLAFESLRRLFLGRLGV